MHGFQNRYCLVAAAIAGAVFATRGYSQVNLEASADVGLQGRSSQFGGSSQTNSPNGTATYLPVGQKGTDSNGEVDAIQRAVIMFQPSVAATGDGTLVFTQNQSGAANTTAPQTGLTLDIWQVSSANAGWSEASADWLFANSVTQKEWVGSGGAGALTNLDDSFMPAGPYPIPSVTTHSFVNAGSGGLGSVSGSGVVSLVGSYTFTGTVMANGFQYSIDIPQALINSWLNDPADNAGLLLTIDQADEAQTGNGNTNALQFDPISKDGGNGNAFSFASSDLFGGAAYISYPTAVPEPASIGIIGTLGFGLLIRRGRRAV